MEKSMGLLRIFIAIPVGYPLIRELAERVHRQALNRPWHWIPPENWHLTLYFFGRCTSLQKDALVDILDVCLCNKLGGRVDLDRWGSFPTDCDTARILAAQGEADTSLKALQSHIAETVSPFAGKPDYPLWKPHVTLARSSRLAPASQLGGRLELSLAATEVVLYSSMRDQTGSRYTPLKRWPLGLPAD